ncbi:hypothetical protein HPB52_021501 [Rhipicephalus sanguineus]|uniref:Myb/SANT-like DNA-binding domain-containing protein n=1 Tax=Rhipicephalus sanguineus TaxID=34632 RepID=A0A9D4QH09_RHISA|nr:hypothetical protein HPB52_021501 [Rhipicephalus sanguineus]
MRVCKILRAEWQYQARVFRESLYLKLHSTYRPTTATQQFRFFSSMANRTTEFVWQHTLPHLRAMIPRRPATSGNSIHTYGDVVLPEYARDVLGMGPKFAVPPRSSAPELVTYVRQVSRLANDAEADRCVSEGLDVVAEYKSENLALSTKNDIKREMASPNERASWTEEETFTLITLWEENFAGLRGQKRNGKIYSAITEALARYGIVRTRSQVHSKIENLRSKYRPTCSCSQTIKSIQVPSLTQVLPMQTGLRQLNRLRQLHLLCKALRNPANLHQRKVEQLWGSQLLSRKGHEPATSRQ